MNSLLSHRFILAALFFLALRPMSYAQETKNVSISDFSELSVAGGITVYLSQADKNTLSITAPSQGLLEKIIVSQQNGKLSIEPKPDEKRGWFGKITNKTNEYNEIKVFVSFKALHSIEAKRAGRVILKTDINAEDFSIGLSSSSRIDLMGLKAKNLEVKASQAGHVEASEAIDTERARLDFSSSASGDFDKITSTNAALEASSASQIKIRELAGERAEIGASSASGVALGVKVKDLSLHTGSAASIAISGTAATLKADSSSASAINGSDLSVDVATSLTASSASKIRVNAQKVLESDSSSAGKIHLRGK